MAADLLIYADPPRQLEAAGSLIIFGIEQLKRAKIIDKVADLEFCNTLMQNNLPYNRMALLENFMWDYLIDAVRILVFFEGYMKAELIIKGFCIHNLNKDGPYSALSALTSQQRKRPVLLDEIQTVIPFAFTKNPDTIAHGGLKETTLGVSTLLLPKYRAHYQFDDILADDIKYFNAVRNKLHLNASAEFELSPMLIARIKRIDAFVDATISRWIKPPEVSNQ
jgi:hypothetical protein